VSARVGGYPDQRKVYMLSRGLAPKWMAAHVRETGVKTPLD
jgi:hypothetical protein